MERGSVVGKAFVARPETPISGCDVWVGVAPALRPGQAWHCP